jgi:hypothetical protein
VAATRGQEIAGRWAACLPRTAAATLGPLRRLAGVTVHEAREEVWLQGNGADEALERSLRALPGARRFAVLSDGQLLESGKRVPYGFLPDGAWQPLAQWLAVRLDAAGLAGRLAERVPLRLVRSALVREANVLLTSLQAWRAYGSEAAQVRLERWSFAVNDAGSVVVRGEPLPPLPGQHFVEVEGVAVPAGWTWQPAVEAAVLRELLGLRDNDLALLHPDGTWDHVSGDNFVRASRSAIRQSAGEGNG